MPERCLVSPLRVVLRPCTVVQGRPYNPVADSPIIKQEEEQFLRSAQCTGDPPDLRALRLSAPSIATRSGTSTVITVGGGVESSTISPHSHSLPQRNVQFSRLHGWEAMRLVRSDVGYHASRMLTPPRCFPCLVPAISAKCVTSAQISVARNCRTLFRQFRTGRCAARSRLRSR